MNEQFQKKNIVSRWKVYKNYCLWSDFTYFLFKQGAEVGKEYRIKLQQENRIKIYQKVFGVLGLVVPFAAILQFNLKTTYKTPKVILSIFFAWNSIHFYTLSSHLGVCLALPKLIKQFYSIPEHTKLYKMLDKYGTPYFIEDRQFDINQVYEDYFKQNKLDENNTDQRVQNDYFIQNKHKYLNNKDAKYYQIFDDKEMQIKGPIYDCLLTRYIYSHSKQFKRRYLRSNDSINQIKFCLKTFQIYNGLRFFYHTLSQQQKRLVNRQKENRLKGLSQQTIIIVIKRRQ